jgi:hypothetical protein
VPAQPARQDGAIERDPTVYYHGTVRLDGDDRWTHIEPDRAPNWSETDLGFAYATTDRVAAQWYAEEAYDRQAWAWTRPVVYEVRPTGPVEADPPYRGQHPRGTWEGDVRSKQPFEIVDEYELPGEWHCERCGSIDHRSTDHEQEQDFQQGSVASPGSEPALRDERQWSGSAPTDSARDTSGVEGLEPRPPEARAGRDAAGVAPDPAAARRPAPPRREYDGGFEL